MVILPLLLMLGSAFLLLFLPYLLDLYLFPRLLVQLPFSDKKLSLSRLTPWNIRGTLTLADADRPTLSVPRFELYYSPSSLLRGELDGLLLDSASLHLDIRPGQPLLRGLPGNEYSTTGEDTTSIFLLPVAVETIFVKNCLVTIDRDRQRPVNIIADGQLTLDFQEGSEKKHLLKAVSGQLVTKGDLNLSGKVSLISVDGKYVLKIQADASDISQLPSLVPALNELRPTGGITLVGKADIAPDNGRLTGYEASIKLPGFHLGKNEMLFTEASPNTPASLRLSGNLTKTSFNLTNLALSEPEKISLALQGELDGENGTIDGTGQLSLARTNSTIGMNYTGFVDHKGAKISYQLASDAFSLDDTLSVSSMTAAGDMTLAGSAIAATLICRIPEIVLKKNDTRLVNLSLQLPVQYPLQETGAGGTLSIGKIRYQGIDSGRFQANLQPAQSGLTFTTSLALPFVAGLSLNCDGSAQMNRDVAVHCRLPATLFDSATFPSAIPLPDGLSLQGKIGAEGEFHIKNGIPGGKFSAVYREGKLTYNENKLSDINLQAVFPHLPLLLSSPGQLCTIGSIELGKIKLSDGRLRFRVEDDQSLFLEKSRFSWCGGKVEASSITLAKDMKELETTLYCDRLGFTELLSQFGIDKTDGQGSLNGRLPLKINRKGLVFDDGFLFSTPGNSGIVRFKDPEQLLQGMPDINKSAYLDYSMQALENFFYNWTKLSFNSKNNELLITMQLDGKPADPLPFGYDNGQIVPTRQGPGLQHPIRLDVNFRLPMQNLFQYGKKIQSIMENM